MAKCKDGLAILFGSDDTTVTLSETGSATAIGDPLYWHENEVWSIAINED